MGDELIDEFRRNGTYLGFGVIVDFFRLRAMERSGMWDEALEQGERVLAELGQFRHHWLDGVMMSLGPIWVRRGLDDPEGLIDEAYRGLAESRFNVKTLSGMTPALIERAAQAGNYQRARQVTVTALDFALPGCARFAAEVVACGLEAEADHAGLVSGGVDQEGARGWLDQLEAGLAAMIDVPLETSGFAKRSHLEFARMTKSDRGQDWAELAETWSQVGNPYEEAYARSRAGEAWLSGSSPDRGEAERHLSQAWSIGASLRASVLLDRIEMLARHGRIQLGGQKPPERTPVDTGIGPTLTPRELDVLGLLAAGRSNGEIGRELFITTKTASTHVSNILRKLGVSNRVEAATLAVRLGLVD